MATGLARRLENVQRRARTAGEISERRIVCALGSAALGFLEKKGTIPISVMGLPTKLVIAVSATLLEANTSGTTRRVFGSVADSNFAIYSYLAAKTEKFIAGDDDAVGEEFVGAEV